MRRHCLEQLLTKVEGLEVVSWLPTSHSVLNALVHSSFIQQFQSCRLHIRKISINSHVHSALQVFFQNSHLYGCPWLNHFASICEMLSWCLPTLCLPQYFIICFVYPNHQTTM